jgi:hypothetical protein
LLEELPGRLAVATGGRVYVDDLAELVDGAVQVDPAAGDFDVGLVHVPAVPDPVSAESGRVDSSGAKRRTHRCTVTWSTSMPRSASSSSTSR